jgi:transglutaminase-like putative cysteine protease
MQDLRLICCAILCSVGSLPLSIQAQFKQPTDEELKMTSDPKAPGAAAVYLDVEENDLDREHYQNYYARIKVLTEKGKEAAMVEIRYPAGVFSIGSISGRTIHSDGTIVSLNVKPEDLVEVKSKDYRRQRKVFTLPSVEVGSILEYSYQLRFNAQFYWHLSPEWEVQRRYFVHKAHFQFTPYDNLNLVWWPKLPRGAAIKTDAAGRYNLDVTDIPPIPEEEKMPPTDSLIYKASFYYRGPLEAVDVEDYWKAKAKEWSKDVDKFAEVTRTIHDAANSLVQASDSDIDKAKKLYAAVQALDNTDFSRPKTESERRELKLKEVNRAEDTWTQKSGNRNQIAWLYLAMLRAAGLTAYGMQVVNRDRAIFDPSYMSLWQLDDDVVILSTGGKEIVLDPGEKMCPFGVVNWKHSGAEGLRQSADGPGRARTPLQVYSGNTIRREGDLTLDGQGGVSGMIEIVMTGQDALFWRQAALESDESDLKKQFDEELEGLVPQGVEAHLDHFLALDEPDRTLMAMVRVKGTLGTATAKRLILPAFFFESRAPLPFVNEEKRQEPVDMHYPGRATDQITYVLPAGASAEGTPEDNNIAWQGRVVLNTGDQVRTQYVTKTKIDHGQITVAWVLATTFTQAQPDDYQGLRGFYQKVAAADQQQIVLTVAPTVRGN